MRLWSAAAVSLLLGAGVRVSKPAKTPLVIASLILGLSICAVYIALFRSGLKELRLRVSYPHHESIVSVDTADLRNINLYNIANNLFSRLVEYNSENQLVPGVSEAFVVQNGEVVFTFGKRVQTIDGHIIDAKDAEISLKRLIMLGRSGHGDIRKLLCPNEKLKSIDQECPGIRVEGNQLLLRPISLNYIPFLISALESADYSIVPKSSLSPNGRKIVDYRNTSGPFYVDKDSDDGAIVLKANKNHYHFNSSMPQEVFLIPTASTKGLEMLESRKADLVTTSEYFTGPEAPRILGKESKYTVFASQPIRVDVVSFSKASIQKFSAQQRFQAAREYAAVKLKMYPTPGAEPTTQFFQALSDGSLLPAQLTEIQLLRTSVVDKFDQPLQLMVSKQFVSPYEGKFDPNHIKVIGTEKLPYDYPVEQRPDMCSTNADSAWTENLTLLGHSFEVGFFHLPGLNSDQWLSNYLDTDSKEKRIESLNKLHFDLLKNAVIVPYAAYPYYAVSTKDWSLNFSTFSSTTDLWRIRRN